MECRYGQGEWRVRQAGEGSRGRKEGEADLADDKNDVEGKVVGQVLIFVILERLW